ncbi:pentapeptide repeat-containing protein [Thalassospira sp. MA62]|nr:pentapeptide repeat-containing protein [Thalassospira sp. MA62]
MSKKKIIYADYSARNIADVRDAVKTLGITNVMTCDDRQKTIDMIHTEQPDLVMIGLHLDGMRGISTIRALRQSALTDDRLAGVPVLLGAPKLDRRAMQDAVDAGIEGVFRQPIVADRLCKIISAVLRNPRRFILQGDYFGPARPEDEANMPAAHPGRRKTDHEAPAPAATATRRRSDQASRARATPMSKEAIRATLNGFGQTFDDGDLPDVPTSHDRAARTENMIAAQSAQETLAPEWVEPAPAPVREEAPATENADDTPDVAPDEELVEINLQDAMTDHKLWVDTGGTEGTAMSIEHADLRNADLENLDLSRCELPYASFRQANCTNAVLRRCNLVAADFIESNLESANLAASRLTGARFKDAMLRNTVFLGSDLSNASFRGNKLLNCDLSGTNLAGADFRDADLSAARGLFSEQIQRARVNANTRLPQSLKMRS